MYVFGCRGCGDVEVQVATKAPRTTTAPRVDRVLSGVPWRLCFCGQIRSAPLIFSDASKPHRWSPSASQ